MKQYSSKQLMPGVWEVTDRPQPDDNPVDVYLVEGSERALLIDAGDSQGDLAGFLRQLTDKPIDLLVTHGHGDHTACIDQFDTVYMSHRDIVLLNSWFDQTVNEAEITDLHGGEIIDLGSHYLEVIALPGHTDGSVLVLDPVRQLLFTSDGLGSGVLWMQLSHCTPIEAYVNELRKLEKRLEGMDDLKVFTGHDGQRGLNYGREYITDVRTIAEGIVSGEMVGVPTQDTSKIFGGLSISHGKMESFIYKPDNIFINR